MQFVENRPKTKDEIDAARNTDLKMSSSRVSARGDDPGEDASDDVTNNDSTIVLDSTNDDSSVVAVVDSPEPAGDANNKKANFKPVKPGGKLLHDDTIEVDDSSDEDDKNNVSLASTAYSQQDSRYVTSVQSPPAAAASATGSAGHLSFHTPAMHSSAIEDADDDTPRAKPFNGQLLADTPTTTPVRPPAPARLATTSQNHSMTVMNSSSAAASSNISMRVPSSVETPAAKAKELDPFFEVDDEFCKEDDDDLAPAHDDETKTEDESKEAVAESAVAAADEGGRDSGLCAASPASPESVGGDGASHKEGSPDGGVGADIANASSGSHKRKRSECESDDDEWEDEEDAVDESQLPKTCTVLRTERGVLYLVGTAHFSKESCDDVARVVRMTRPDAVMLELCGQRTDILRLDEETLAREGQEMSPARMVQTMRSYGTVQGAMYLLMLSMSAKLTRELGMAPGGEFRAALAEANRIPGCQVHLADRPIHITMKRALSSLSAWQKVKLGWSILTSDDNITKEEVEKCKNKDLMLEELAGEYPSMTKVFVDERDQYLSYTLHSAASAVPVPVRGTAGRFYYPAQHRHPPPAAARVPGDDGALPPRVVVGVVGIGHVKGITNYWGKMTAEDAARVSRLPPKSRAGRAAVTAVRLGVYGALLLGVHRLVTGSWVPGSVHRVVARAIR